MGATPSTNMRPRSITSDLEMKIQQIIDLMKNRQLKVQAKYDENSEVFQQYSLTNMNTYVQVADMIATDMADPLLTKLMEDCKDIWLNTVYPKLCNNYYLLRSDESKFASFGKILAGIAFIFGYHHLGLTYLITVLKILPNDMVVYAAVLKWACLLGEFDVVKMYAENHHLQYSCQVAMADFVCVCRYFCDFFGPTPPSKISDMLDRLLDINEKLLSCEAVPLQSFYSRQLIHKICSIAALMPNADVRKYNDYNYHMRMATECSLSVLSHKNENFMELKTKILLLRFSQISESETFLMDALALTDFCVTEMAYSQALMDSGCISDCEGHVLCALFLGTKIAVAPLRILEPLNMLHYVKLRTSDDHDKLKGIRAMTSLFLGRVFEDQNKTIVSPFRTKLLEENHIFETQIVNQSFTKKPPVFNTIPFAKHHKKCSCFICYETMHNSNFFVQKRYCDLLLDNLSLKACKDRADEMRSFGGILLQKEQDQLYRNLYKNRKLNNFVCRLPLITNVCIIICNCLLVNPDMPEHDRKLLCNAVIKHANIFPLHLRSYWLLVRQLKRKCSYSNRFPWLQNSENNGIDNERVDNLRYEAANDFVLFEHIFFLDWRRRICLYLGAELLEDDPWQSAFYFIESFGTSLRQYLRVHEKPPLDLRFDNVDSFKVQVQNFPEDFTYIQLVLDDSDVLWLIRCSAGFIPVVLPFTCFKDGNIPERFLQILVDNDNSMTNYTASDYWIIRENLEEKMREIILDVENVWFASFRCLLIPFEVISNQQIVKKIAEVENFLREGGIYCRNAKFLAMLFFHTNYDDYYFLLRIFCFLQTDKIIPENIIFELLKKFSGYHDSFYYYLKNDRYIVLAVSQELSSYPWESLPVLNDHIFITRIQSLHFFVRLLIKYQHKIPLYVDAENSCCVFDNSENLLPTHTRMTNELNINSFMEAFFYTSEQYKLLEYLGEFEIFLFIGHGNGGLNNFALRCAKCRAVPILMGCSSVRIKDKGRGFDGESVAHDFIVAGAPSVIGCLWMVTDGEIDKFLIKFIELCISEWSNRLFSIPVDCKVSNDDRRVMTFPSRLMIKSLVDARKACRFPLLTGASVVAYGFPVMADPAPLEAHIKHRLALQNNRRNSINCESNNN